MPRALRISPGLAVAVTVVILAIVNVVDVRVPHASLVAAGPCAPRCCSGSPGWPG